MPLLWSSDKLISHEFPNPAYLLDPVVPQGGTVLFYGKPGVGKTQLILTLSQAINSGTDFLNRWPARQGPVVVIQADMTGQIQQDRVARVIQDVNLSETYWVVEEDGSAPYINIMTRAFRCILRKSVHFTDCIINDSNRVNFTNGFHEFWVLESHGHDIDIGCGTVFLYNPISFT